MKQLFQPTSIENIINSQTPQAGNAYTPLQESQEQSLPDSFFSSDEDDEKEFDEQSEAPDFQANLAEYIDEITLDNIAQELIQMVSDDILASQPWFKVMAETQQQMGLMEDESYEEPFEGATTVTYPIIVKAQTQFVARALPELWPNNPANAVVLGTSTQEKEDQAQRVAATVNYQITYQDRGNKRDFRKMLWWLPLTGSMFRRVFHDPIRNINMVRTVRAEDLIAPYNTVSLEDATHFTHRIWESNNNLLKKQHNGFYRDVDVGAPQNMTPYDREDTIQTIRDVVDGKENTEVSNKNTGLHEIYDVYCYYDLPEFEETDDQGEETGIGLPYIITIHKNSGKVLAIRRNWKEDDELRLMRIYFSHYIFQEGPGFYGCSLFHLIGSIQIACTGALRAFGDSLAFSLLQGGWKSKDATISGSERMSPGNFIDVDMNLDDINKAIKLANFQPPPGVTLQYIQLLDNQAQGIVSTQNILTGDASPVGAPVGSTLAIIEQAQKVISAQHKTLHEAFSDELSILSDLNYDYLPEEASFAVPGYYGVMRRADFSDDIDVIPTADPSVASFQQRIAIDQSVMQLGNIPEFKPFFKNAGYPLLVRQMQNLQVPDMYDIIMDETEAQQVINQPQQPSPEQIKIQIEQQRAEADIQEMQARVQLEQQDIGLKDKKIEADFILKNKDIDAKYGMIGITPGIAESADKLAIDAASQAITQNMKEQQQQMMAEQQSQMEQMQQAQQTQQQPPMQEMPAENPKQSLLKRIMQRMRGK